MFALGTKQAGLLSKAAIMVCRLRRPCFRRGGRAVECTGLENRQGVKPFGGSNPPLSANVIARLQVADVLIKCGRVTQKGCQFVLKDKTFDLCSSGDPSETTVGEFRKEMTYY